MTRTRYDYVALKQEYITTDVSVRELCRKNGIRTWSTVNERKKAEGWDELRQQYRDQLTVREVGALVDARIQTIAEIHDELLYAIRVAVRRFTNDRLRETNPDPVSARDLMGLIDKFQLLTGGATDRTETRNLNVGFDLAGLLRDAPPDLLRELAELARSNGAGAQSVGRGPLVVLEGTRSA